MLNPSERREIARLFALGLVAEHLVELYYDSRVNTIWERSRTIDADIFRLAIECAVKIRCIRALVEPPGGTP